ncbi:MAG: NlpC/P60 family protein [Pseudomonadota bacterium]
MSDPRETPANGRVAHVSLVGVVDAEAFVAGEAAQIWGEPFLCRAPSGDRDRQLLHGDDFLVLERAAGWAFGQSQKDGYCGYVPQNALHAPMQATHRVWTRQSHLYEAPDLKQPAIDVLSMNARLRRLDGDEVWSKVETPNGAMFVPSMHLEVLSKRPSDLLTVAEAFLGTPYIWGGNGGQGIDCSGLVQAACLACGRACPGDSDQQEDRLGQDLGVGGPLARNDLVFWPGHVAIATGDGRILHATARYMAVVYEDFESARARIAAAGEGPVTRQRRLEV